MATTAVNVPQGVERWSLRLRIFLFFSLIAAGSVVSTAGAAYVGYHRLDDGSPLSALIFAAILAAFGMIALTTWVWFLFDEHVARPLISLAGDLRARAHADVRRSIDAAQARYLGDLAPAAAAVSSHLADSLSDLDAAIQRERERILSEHARLEAILRDTPTGCILCSRDHRIALYNKKAVEQIGELGLGRDLLSILTKEPVEDALERLGQRNDAATTDLLCTTQDGQRILQTQMRLYSGDGESGYLLTFRDVTEELAGHERREDLLCDVFDQLQRPAANLLTTIEALRTPDGAAPEARAKLQGAVVAETQALANTVTTLRDRYERDAASWWPMSETPASDILFSVQARLAQSDLAVEVNAQPIAIRCDGFAIARLLGDLALDVAAQSGARQFELCAAQAENEVAVDLSWDGTAYPIAALEHRVEHALDAGFPSLTLRDCLRSHRTDVWPERCPSSGRSRLRLPLLLAAPNEGNVATNERLVFHELSLLSETPPSLDPRLRDMSFVVFDTETTGLYPDKGDEIVQIAAVRIVRGRVLSDDRFDTLVNPRRAIPRASTEIHGIDAAMVETAPTIEEAGRKFRQYCGDSALIAHNAPFDMAFLGKHADAIGAFDGDVLDTVLMSAILFGRSAGHGLDDIAERLGAPIDASVRHTALGDALAAAAVASKAIPMMDAVGVATLSDYNRAAAPHHDLTARISTS